MYKRFVVGQRLRSAFSTNLAAIIFSAMELRGLLVVELT
jgi:hypothetical protein